MLIDPSEVFHTINHNLLMANLGCDTESLKLIKSYLTNRLQIANVIRTFSSLEKLLLGVQWDL